jgi:hypothetical protein
MQADYWPEWARRHHNPTNKKSVIMSEASANKLRRFLAQQSTQTRVEWTRISFARLGRPIQASFWLERRHHNPANKKRSVILSEASE